MDTPSNPIRLTVPIDSALSLRLTILARRIERTRGWLARRFLADACDVAIRRYAELEGKPVDQWIHEEEEAFRVEVGRAIADYQTALHGLTTPVPEGSPKGVD